MSAKLEAKGILAVKNQLGFKLEGIDNWFQIGSFRQKYLEAIPIGTQVTIEYFIFVGKKRTFYNVTRITVSKD